MQCHADDNEVGERKEFHLGGQTPASWVFLASGCCSVFDSVAQFLIVLLNYDVQWQFNFIIDVDKIFRCLSLLSNIILKLSNMIIKLSNLILK